MIFDLSSMFLSLSLFFQVVLDSFIISVNSMLLLYVETYAKGSSLQCFLVLR